MARRKGARSRDLGLRLSADERRRVEAAAAEEGVPVSTWLRRLVLRETAAAEVATRRREAARQIAAVLRASFDRLPDASAHADEVERARDAGWRR